MCLAVEVADDGGCQQLLSARRLPADQRVCGDPGTTPRGPGPRGGRGDGAAEEGPGAAGGTGAAAP